MSKALYRKYRSKTLDEIVGQDHITGILKRAIEQEKIAHAYLLTGPKGVGKTSIARILAHQINQLPYTEESTHLDIIEIDAASNNSVDDVRDLREKVRLAPISAKRKVYIIDEVHMLSKQAFNALLKTLEEPPEHIVFILATTDADKLPATIISRVQRFNFRTITEHDAARHLATIAGLESITIEDDAIKLIAEHGRGSFRDSISLLDQMQHLSDGMITRQMVAELLGAVGTDTLDALLSAYQSNDIKQISSILKDTEAAGTTAPYLSEQLARYVRQKIFDHPQYLPLLDSLLEVPKSAWPSIKLLTALAMNVQSLASQPPVEAAPTAITEPPRAKLPKVQSSEPKPVKAAQKTVKHPAKPNTPKVTGSEKPFDYEAFLEHVKQADAMAAYAVLKQCGYSYTNDTITIYAGRKFSKNKLDKSLDKLSAALQTLGVNAAVAIVEGTKPPQDAVTASIIDMMGGGEEISAS